MPGEKIGLNPFITENVFQEVKDSRKYNCGDELLHMLAKAYDQGLTETDIALSTIFLLTEAEQSLPENRLGNVIDVYRASLEALIETGNLHTETFRQFFQQYNNFIILRLQLK
jgi:hypothetical protein